MPQFNIKQSKGATQGSVLFLGPGGRVSENNGQLYWDISNNRLIIGTAAGSAKLEVFGNSGLKVTSQDSGYGGFTITPYGSTQGYTSLRSSDGDEIRFGGAVGSPLNNGEFSFINPSSNIKIAINHNNPSATTHIVGSGTSSSNFILKADDSNGVNYFNVRDDGAVNLFGGNGLNSTLSIRQRSFSNSMVIDVYNNDTSKILFRASDSGSAGTITIGNSIIDVNNYTGEIGMGVSSGGSNRLRLQPIAAGFDVLSVRVSGGAGSLNVVDNGTGDSVLYLQNSLGSSTQIYISSSGSTYFNGGSVGIGITSPLAKLHVRGATSNNTSSAFRVENSDGSHFMRYINDGEFNIDGFSIRNIGTTTYFKTNGTGGYLWNNTADSLNLMSLSNTGNLVVSTTTIAPQNTGARLSIVSPSISDSTKEYVAEFFKYTANRAGFTIAAKEGTAYFQAYTGATTQSVDMILGGYSSTSGSQLETLTLYANGDSELDGNVIINHDLLVYGSFSVLGTSSTINTINLTVQDPIILLASTQSGSPTLDSGFFINRGTGATQAFIWDESADEFTFIQTNDPSTALGNISISSYANIRASGATLSQLYVSGDSGVGTIAYAGARFTVLSPLGYGNGTIIASNATSPAESILQVRDYSNITKVDVRTDGSAYFAGTVILNNSNNMSIGTASPTNKLHLFSTSAGAIRIQDTTQASGYVLVSDSNGVGTWTSSTSLNPTGITGTGSLGYIPIWSGSTSLTSSYFSQSTTSVRISNGKFISSANENMQIDFGSGTYLQLSTDAGAGGESFLFMTSTQVQLSNDGAAFNYLAIQSTNAILAHSYDIILKAGTVSIGTATTMTASMAFFNGSNSNYVRLRSGVTTTSYDLTLPTTQGSANTFLSNNGSGVLSWVSGSTGSGTTDYLARWISSSQLGTGSVYDNGTKVGIRTTTPSFGLEVISGTVGFTTGSTFSAVGNTAQTIFVQNKISNGSISSFGSVNSWINYPLTATISTLQAASGNIMQWVGDSTYPSISTGTLRVNHNSMIFSATQGTILSAQGVSSVMRNGAAGLTLSFYECYLAGLSGAQLGYTGVFVGYYMESQSSISGAPATSSRWGVRIEDAGPNWFAGKVGIGSAASSPSYELDMPFGTASIAYFRMSTGASNGYVLASDGSGVGTWQSTGTVSGIGTVNKYSSTQSFTAGITYSFSHNLNSDAIVINIWDESTGDFIGGASIKKTSVNVVDVRSSVTISNGRVVVLA